ncbi:MAG TPA: alpha/beta fold hydrolase [Vicinamibacterales bacterium]|nr:alpha/beta fold hydrolase [Vicinamibacterales bacterium]
MHRQYVHLGSRTLAYFDSAPGDNGAPLLVLIHAFPLGAGMWEGQAGALPPGWRLIAPDLRGFGGSTIGEPDTDPSIDDYAADVVDLLHELEVSSAVIGGCSMGGYAALAVVRRAPALVRALILIDTRAGADTPEGRANRRGMLAVLDREGPAGIARDMMPTLLGTTTLTERPDVEPVVRRLVKQQSAAAVRGGIHRMMTRPDSSEVLQNVKVATLIIVGEEDTLTPPEEARKMAAIVPQAELVVLPRTGHLPSLEQPEAFNDALSAFLSGL